MAGLQRGFYQGIIATLVIIGTVYVLYSRNNAQKNGAYENITKQVVRYQYLYKQNQEICQLQFVEYKPSTWETEWTSHIREWQYDVCGQLDQQQENLDIYLKYVTEDVRTYGRTEEKPEGFDDVFSQMVYRKECPKSMQKESEIVVKYIEPLVGFLREPTALCPQLVTEERGEKELQSVDFILMDTQTPLTCADLSLVLMGPSSWNQEPGGQEWWYTQFTERGYNVVAMQLWGDGAPQSVFDSLPNSDIMGIYQYLGTPISASPANKAHSWSVMLKSRREGKVVVVLDMDSPSVELTLVSQLVKNATIFSGVDEFFFEHQSDIPEMKRFWGTKIEGTLEDSYNIFSTLRSLGVRAHSWS